MGLADVSRDTVSGRWQQDRQGLAVSGSSFARVMLPAVLRGSYDLEVEFVRTEGTDAVAFVVPVGSERCAVLLSADGGKAHGVETIDGRRLLDKNNPLVRRPGGLANNRKHTAWVSVRESGAKSTFELTLNSRVLVRSLSTNWKALVPGEWFIPSNQRPALGANNCAVTFRRVRLRLVSGSGSILEPRQSAGLATALGTRPPTRVPLPQPVSPVSTMLGTLVDQKYADLLSRVDLAKDTVEGTWKATADGLTASPARNARLMLPAVVQGGYDFFVAFTRHSGDDAIALIVPVGARQCTVILSGRGGAVSGLEMVDGRDLLDSPAVKRPGTLTNGQRYRAAVSVRPQFGDLVGITVMIDGKHFLNWYGKTTSLGNSQYWHLPDPNRPGLGVNRGCSATFHSVLLQPNSSRAGWTRALQEAAEPLYSDQDSPYANPWKAQARLLVGPASDGSITLPAASATLDPGQSLKLEGGALTSWRDARKGATWGVYGQRHSRYLLEVNYACAQKSENSQWAFSLAGPNGPFSIFSYVISLTGPGEEDYKTFTLGAVPVRDGGPFTLNVQLVAENPSVKLRWIRLVPAK